MRFTVQARKTFTTPLSASEVITAINRLINTKSKFLFILPSQYFGYVNTKEFNLGGHKGDRFGIFSPRIKGGILAEKPTTIEIRFVIPYLTTFFFLIIPITFSLVAAFTDQMTINGVVREPELSERIGFAFLGVFIPAPIFYISTIWPLKRVEAHLIDALKLEKKKAASE